MLHILSPVGRWDDPVIKSKSGNKKNDIETVQKLLTTASERLGKPNIHPGTTDGKISKNAAKSDTLKAIENFQGRFMRSPDIRVDVRGTTLKKLNEFKPKPTTPTTGGNARVVMNNKNATRNLDITSTLKKKLATAVGAVFGSGAVATVYSGGQPAKGTSTKRTGSVRHDLGHAADLTIVDGSGKKVGLEGMEKLGQWWLAKKYGCAGVGMQSGRGIHLDEWNSKTGPSLKSGMGPYWTYSGAGSKTKSILRKGHSGQLP